jgi:hypothetical protein
MLKLEASEVLASFSYLGGTTKYLQLGRTELLRRGESALAISVQQYAEMMKAVSKLAETSEQLEMVAARAAASRAKESLEKNYSTSGYDLNRVSALVDVLNPLLGAFKDEMESRVVVSLSPRHSALYQSNSPIFGKNVETAFPGAADDINEAGKCLAVEQSTAAVFHLMRAMERAIQTLSSKLGIENVERDWGKLLSDINTKIVDMPKGELRDRWSESHTHLYHVKQAWRNSTMHPKQTYTMNEATAIFEAVRSFMTDLCTLVSET